MPADARTSPAHDEEVSEAHHAYLGLGLGLVRLTHIRNTLAADWPTRPVRSRRRDRAIRIQRSNDDATDKRLWLLIGLVVVLASVALVGSIVQIIRSDGADAEPGTPAGSRRRHRRSRAGSSVRIRMQSNMIGTSWTDLAVIVGLGPAARPVGGGLHRGGDHPVPALHRDPDPAGAVRVGKDTFATATAAALFVSAATGRRPPPPVAQRRPDRRRRRRRCGSSTTVLRSRSSRPPCTGRSGRWHGSTSSSGWWPWSAGSS